mgnify:CR=1 FL=1
MDKKIAEYLKGRGYINIPNNAGNEIGVYYRVDNMLAIVVMTIDARKILISETNFRKLKNDVGGMFAGKGYTDIKIFTLFIVNNINIGKKMTANEEFSWIVDMRERRLVIYEHQLIDFDNLKTGLEEAIENWSKENGYFREKLPFVHKLLSARSRILPNYSGNR